MKVAINNCFGGFGLSEKAFEMLLNRKGVEHQKVRTGFSLSPVTFYKAGVEPSADTFLYEYDYTIDRSDPDLIAVIEALGKEVNTNYSDVVIVEIPDDVKWTVSEYDGLEHVAEVHRTWYGQ